MSYDKRRYKVINGKLEKRWADEHEDGWFKAKADAWADFEASLSPQSEKVSAPAPDPAPKKTAGKKGRPRKPRPAAPAPVEAVNEADEDDNIDLL